ncbi:MAG: DNA/RNA nuclease SfsA [Lactobacillus sp.]|nr:DNA/RNA nuclease SfsA [Lacticaseibacillus suilingensis]MCI1893187.1 DNA/RNA nuclease SfsA [Lactobacillus sp.]MCI1918244.1 DNA/RNA nuclease SfsA [Lactobacillus sp.]MCI1940863.1 DNA/RNA nuclease SfsA [Lactobacillus sp.]MCI1971242.1 DNA/RNA nuclease SfsA [Lactobacillus sp.]MCI2017597.1 DNA/RNA nuclease SfsA [Lactobacillus sp.]
MANLIQIGHVIARISRFTVTVQLGQQVVNAHLSNTGRNKELLRVGTPISIRRAAKPERKTPYDILAVRRDGRWINIDSLAPNRVVRRALMAGQLKLPGCPLPYAVHPETQYLDSRLDFAGQAQNGQPWFVEVKGVTLANGPLAAFPDAPTARGLKHVHTLTHAAQAGYRAYLVFVVQMPEINRMTIYQERFPELAPAVTAAKAAGVKVLAYRCVTGPGQIKLGARIHFDENLPFHEVLS